MAWELTSVQIMLVVLFLTLWLGPWIVGVRHLWSSVCTFLTSRRNGSHTEPIWKSILLHMIPSLRPPGPGQTPVDIENQRFDSLRHQVNENLFGQHLASSIVLNDLQHHMSQECPEKARVFIFAGSLGLGKTLLADTILGGRFREWFGPNCVKTYLGPGHFPAHESVRVHRARLRSDVIETVRESTNDMCKPEKDRGRALFIFDELDIMNPDVLTELTVFLGRATSYEGLDFRKSVFIFITNIGDDTINATTRRHMLGEIQAATAGGAITQRDRQLLTSNDFRKGLEADIVNGKGGLKNTDLIRRQLYDHLIPFLPLERYHIRRCIEKEINKEAFRDHRIIPSNIMDKITWWPEPINLFSSEGAKQIQNRVLAEVTILNYANQPNARRRRQPQQQQQEQQQ